VDSHCAYARVLLFDRDDVEDKIEAIRYLKFAAGQGHAASQCLYGSFRIREQLFSEEVSVGVSYLMLAADQGHAEAQFISGEFLSSRLGSRDSVGAARYYRLAADQNCADAQLELGGVFWRVEGFGIDVTEQNRKSDSKWK
jgi:TPR repeat protein